MRVFEREEINKYIRDNSKELREEDKDALNRIAKVGTELWVTNEEMVGVHFGMNDYIIINDNLMNILCKIESKEVTEAVKDTQVEILDCEKAAKKAIRKRV